MVPLPHPAAAFGKRLYRNWGWLIHGLSFAAFYTAFIAFFRLLLLSVFTYWVVSSRKSASDAGPPLPPPTFHEVSEAFFSNSLLTAGLCAGAFALIFRAIHPIVRELTPLKRWGIQWDTDMWFTRTPFQRDFMPGAMQGTLVAVGIVFAFLIAGAYRYLGVYIQPAEAPLEAAGILARVLAIVAFAYVEEWVFRGVLLKSAASRIPNGAAVALSTAAYLGSKLIQFDFSLLQTASLTLLSVALCVRALKGDSPMRSVGIVSGILIVFQLVLSLPLLGGEASGILLVKPAGAGTQWSGSLGRFITGGQSGPLSSFAFQGLLLIDIIRNAWKRSR